MSAYRIGELVNLADDLLRLDSMITAAPADYPGLPHLRRERDAVAAEIDRSGVAELLTRCDAEDWSAGGFGWIQTTEIRALLGLTTEEDS